ncbi:MAG: internal scaffolding protein [Arizlama microvirus]|nr:MAG: internal scaffolding protein [Arizlama microvirus]
MTKRTVRITDMDTGEQMEVPLMRTQYNYDRDAVSRETGTVCETETRTQQHFKEECDINQIMKRFGITGELPQNIRPVLPEDYEEIFDFQSAMNTIRRAQEAFMQMPSGIRARFQNNPQVFTEFFSQEENRLEAEKMGLVLPRKPEPKPAEPEEKGGQTP